MSSLSDKEMRKKLFIDTVELHREKAKELTDLKQLEKVKVYWKYVSDVLNQGDPFNQFSGYDEETVQLLLKVIYKRIRTVKEEIELANRQTDEDFQRRLARLKLKFGSKTKKSIRKNRKKSKTKSAKKLNRKNRKSAKKSIRKNRKKSIKNN